MKKSFYTAVIITVLMFGLMMTQAFAVKCEKVAGSLTDPDGNLVGLVKLRAENCKYIEIEIELKYVEANTEYSVSVNGVDYASIITDDDGEGESELEHPISPNGEESISVTVVVGPYSVTVDVPICCKKNK